MRFLEGFEVLVLMKRGLKNKNKEPGEKIKKSSRRKLRGLDGKKLKAPEILIDKMRKSVLILIKVGHLDF